LGIKSGAQVIGFDALKALEKLSAVCVEQTFRFDCIFLDPPYAAAKEYQRVLEFIGSSNLLAADGIVIAEHQSKFALDENRGSLRLVRMLKQGNAALSFYRWATPPI
jgi:16S rRNA (guanine966-N2)-methyltransferase